MKKEIMTHAQRAQEMMQIGKAMYGDGYVSFNRLDSVAQNCILIKFREKHGYCYLTAIEEKKALNKLGRANKIYGRHWDRWDRAHPIWRVTIKSEFEKIYGYKPLFV